MRLNAIALFGPHPLAHARGYERQRVVNAFGTKAAVLCRFGIARSAVTILDGACSHRRLAALELE